MSQKDKDIKTVHLSGLVLMKIIKHCKDALPDLVTGQLLGLDVDTTLDITNCFPLPHRHDDDDESSGGNQSDMAYQRDMMKCLRDINMDSNTVGWYQSTYLESYLNVNLVETLFNYQQEFGKKCVCLIFDPLRTMHGNLLLKALRLSDRFVSVYTKNRGVLSQDLLSKHNLQAKDIFDEVPIVFHSPALIDALVYDLVGSSTINVNFDRLDLTAEPYLERSLESLIESTEELANDNNRYISYLKNVQKQQQYIQKKKDAGQESDLANIRAPQPPNRLSSLLTTQQISNMCRQLASFSGETANKLFIADSLHEVSDSPAAAEHN